MDFFNARRLSIVSAPILVTGGTGLVGRALVTELLAARQQVRLLVRRRDHPTLADWHQALADGQLTLAEGELNDAGSLAPAFVGVERVVHAAGLVSYRAADRLRLLQVNAEGTGRVVDHALEAGVKHLVYVSSVAALGRVSTPGQAADELITEATAFMKTGASLYGHSKHLGERHVLRGVEEGLSAAIACPGVVLGPARDWGASSAALVRIADSALGMAYPLGGNGFVGLGDIGRALTRMTLGPARMGQRFILVSENLSYRELLTRLRLALGRGVPRLPLAPEWAVPAAWLVEQLTQLSSSRSNLTSRAMQTMSQSWRYDNRRFRESYEFIFTPMQSVIAETVAAYRAAHPR